MICRENPSRRWLSLKKTLVGLLCAGLALGQSTRPNRQVSEQEVKAAYLLNFVKFVEWDPTRDGGEAPFTICIAGTDPFGSALDRLVEGERIENRRIVIERVRRWQNPCRVFFIGSSELDAAQLLAGVGSGVLTVGEESRFLRDGGMIALVVEDRKVRFDINLKAARRASVRMSSRLLDVARQVER